jgi:hypothetical protein
MSDVPNLPSARVERFSLDTALGTGWEQTWKYLWPLIGITSATFLLGSIPTVFTTLIMWVNSSPWLIAVGLIVSLCGAVLQDLIQMGMINVQLRMLEGHPVQTRDVFALSERVFRYIGATILYKGMVFFGILCFIVPGIFLHLKFQFYGYFIVEYNMGPIQALKASAKITEGSKMDLLMFAAIQWIIGTFGAMILFIGSFPASIINQIASASVYRQLVKATPDLDLSEARLLSDASGATSSGTTDVQALTSLKELSDVSKHLKDSAKELVAPQIQTSKVPSAYSIFPLTKIPSGAGDFRVSLISQMTANAVLFSCFGFNCGFVSLFLSFCGFAGSFVCAFGRLLVACGSSVDCLVGGFSVSFSRLCISFGSLFRFISRKGVKRKCTADQTGGYCQSQYLLHEHPLQET